MVPIALLLAVWLPALIGLGLPVLAGVRRATGGSVGGVARRVAFAGLLGAFVVSTAASAVGLALPVRPALSIVLLSLGWIGVVRRRRLWRRVPRRGWLHAAVLATVVIAFDARGVPWYDTGLYHLQAVAWMSNGPLPRGLANLHAPLGYDCAWFAFAAVVEFPRAAGRSCFVVNALLAVLAASPGLDAVMRVGRGRRWQPESIVFGLALFPLAEFGFRRGMVSSLAPDLIVMVLVLFAAAAWVRSPRNALLAAILACLAVSIKPSAGPLWMAAVLATVAGRRWIRRPRLAWAIVCLLAMTGLIWLFRGVWLSGYPAFPFTVGRVAGLPWAATPADVRYAQRSIEYWSKYRRDYVAVPLGSPWVAAWVRRVGMSEPILVAVAVFAAGLVLLGARHGPLTPAGRRAGVAAVAMLPAVGFWFAVAPDVRFGFGYAWAVASLSVAAALDGRRWPSVGPRAWRVLKAAVAIALCIASRPDHRLLKATLVRWPPIPVATLATRHTLDGTTVRTPVGDDRVWAAPSPATPDFNPTLRCIRDAHGRIREFDVSHARVEARPGDD